MSRQREDCLGPLPRHRRGTFAQAADRERRQRECQWGEQYRALVAEITRLKDQLAALDARRCIECGELDGYHARACTHVEVPARAQDVDPKSDLDARREPPHSLN